MNQKPLAELQEAEDKGSHWLAHFGKGLIGLLISAAFIALTLRGADLVQVKAYLWKIDKGMLLPVFISLSVIFLVKAFRWWYLMFPLKRIAFKRIFIATIIGFMANNALPLRGGDLLRAHLLGRQEDMGTTTIFATVALDRVFEVLSLLTVSLVVLFLIPLPRWMWDSAIILGLVFLVSVIGIAAFRSPPKLIKKWWKAVLSLLPGRLEEVLSKSIKQVRLGLDAGTGKIRLTNLYILAVSETALTGFLVYYSLKMIGIEVSLVAIMSVIVAMNLAVIVPAAPGNLGVFEFAVLTTLEFFQYNKSTALSGAVILHAISIIPVSLLGFIFFIREWMLPKGGLMK